MKRSKTSVLLILLTIVGLACQEEESVLLLPELLNGRQWELENRTIVRPGGSVEDVLIDYCDIELWEFETNMLFIDYHFISLAEEECAEESYSLSQSYRLQDNEVLLEGNQRGLTEEWDSLGFLLSDMQVVRLSNQRIRITYHLTENDPAEPTAHTEVTDTYLLYATTKHPF